eukprot:CAMPEP_0178902912 /NCGR_PEP_ID=MMETSP0786-20121207/4867_1 /TAXON_ID=186022 /ORGANISM="Thalassionema frauenfeldii, Strain CCMP 1798" /LENGTH=92 /DNA_ID=CAMNT_0020574229 /DNA_START=16 /DNA_END=297 /DNA_ORIENTATION=+
MTNNEDNKKEYPYVCNIEVSCPTAESAKRTCLVLEVDKEIGDRVQKTISRNDEDDRMLLVTFRATEAKMLRVAVSTFCDYLNVALKCQQEFG